MSRALDEYSSCPNGLSKSRKNIMNQANHYQFDDIINVLKTNLMTVVQRAWPIWNLANNDLF